MFAIGVYLILIGYTAVYTGASNLRNGGGGPTFAQALGFSTAVAPPGADQPNLTGQPPKLPTEGGQLS